MDQPDDVHFKTVDLMNDFLSIKTKKEYLPVPEIYWFR